MNPAINNSESAAGERGAALLSRRPGATLLFAAWQITRDAKGGIPALSHLSTCQAQPNHIEIFQPTHRGATIAPLFSG
jgi:hypothetical protein